jgi:hypothetical protein
VELFGSVLGIGGAVGIVLTRLGAYDPGGIMRRMDWFGTYELLERSWLGGRGRRTPYTFFGGLAIIGVLLLVW